jgi:hypothetical protein
MSTPLRKPIMRTFHLRNEDRQDLDENLSSIDACITRARMELAYAKRWLTTLKDSHAAKSWPLATAEKEVEECPDGLDMDTGKW